MNDRKSAKCFRKVGILGLLTLTLILFTKTENLFVNSVQANPAVWVCDIAAEYNALMSCGDGFSGTVSSYNTRVEDCYAQAQTQCANSGNPYCVDGVRIACEIARINSYNQRYPSYGDCVTGQTGVMYNVDYCTPAIDPCPEALYQANVCIAQFPYVPMTDPNFTEIFESREACLNAVPHGRPQGRDAGCPGFPIGF